MIAEKELYEAIAECQGQRNPNANTCIKLASYYTILDHMIPEKVQSHSFAGNPTSIAYSGDSEFAQIINGRDSDEVMAVMDELMDTLFVVNPRLYASVIRKLEG